MSIVITDLEMPTERESYNLTIKYNGTVLDTETGTQVAEAHELSAEVEAEWTEKNNCSRCGEEACAGYDEEPWLTRYCPHCGAKMKNPEEYE